jgi:PPK2 family polyphosphate:nucleotide phosphotransferase
MAKESGHGDDGHPPGTSRVRSAATGGWDDFGDSVAGRQGEARSDPADSPKGLSKEEGEAALPALLDELGKLQFRLYAEHRQGLLVVLQGIDGSGKDGTIRHVMTGMNPAGCVVTSFKEPTKLELDHDFLWRVHPHVPAKGDVAVFNRSHYEDVLVVRVHRLVPKDVWSKRYGLINDFEHLLRAEAGTTVVKFFLHISKEEQLRRFEQRLEDPERQWKIAESDYTERERWDEYVEAYEDVLTRPPPGTRLVRGARHAVCVESQVARALADTLGAWTSSRPSPRSTSTRTAPRSTRLPGSQRQGQGEAEAALGGHPALPGRSTRSSAVRARARARTRRVSRGSMTSSTHRQGGGAFHRTWGFRLAASCLSAPWPPGALRRLQRFQAAMATSPPRP